MNMMKLYAPFIREATLRVTTALQSEGHGGDPSPEQHDSFPPKKPAGLSACLCVARLQVHEVILWAIFAPAGHRPTVFLRRRAAGRQPESHSSFSIG